MTTQTITDPKDWRAGDRATYEHPAGYPVAGTLHADGQGQLLLGPWIVRFSTGWVAVPNPTVTREVPDISEPTGLGAVVELARAAVIVRADDDEDEGTPWRVVAPAQDNGAWCNWQQIVEEYGPAVRIRSSGVSDAPTAADEDTARTALAQAYDAGREMGEKGSTGGLRLAMLRLRIEALADELAESADRWGAAGQAPLLRHLAGRLRALAEETTRG